VSSRFAKNDRVPACFSPDLVQIDYFLLRCLKKHLRVRQFSSDKAIQRDVSLPRDAMLVALYAVVVCLSSVVTSGWSTEMAKIGSRK